MKRRLAPTQSPVVSKTLNRQYAEARASSIGRWGVACLALSLPILLDLYLHLLSYYSGLSDAMVWFTEIVVLALLGLSALYDCVYYSRVALSHPKLNLTPAQKKLLHVGQGLGSGYGTVNRPTPFGTPLPPPSSSSHSHSSPLTLVTPSRHHSPYTTPRSTLATPQSTVSTPSHTPKTSGGGEGEGEVMSSQQALESYLRSENEKELQLSQSSPDLTWPSNTISLTQNSPSSYLRKYHVATRGQSPSLEGGSPLLTEDEAVWSELGISKEHLLSWTEKCRRWLAETVVIRIAEEIDKLNTVLSKGPTPSITIGAASVSSLRRECKRRGSQVPTLHLVLPYLEVSSKQKYLVHRIKELSSGGYLSVYRWNDGGMCGGRPWTPDLPSDPQIVLHLLSVYLDNHLPLSPLSTYGRPFSSHFLLKTPDKPEAKTSGIAIYQSTLSPPHYNIVIGNKMVELPKGRNNLFHAIVALLHHIKTMKTTSQLSNTLLTCSLQLSWIIE